VITLLFFSKQEDEPRQVKVRGSEVTIKTVTVEDATGKAKVTLWREMAESPVRPGDHVKIMDVVVNTYNNVTTLQTTMTSTVEVSLVFLPFACATYL
jgi:ssDNA-binding replication factor A large subunit